MVESAMERIEAMQENLCTFVAIGNRKPDLWLLYYRAYHGFRVKDINSRAVAIIELCIYIEVFVLTRFKCAAARVLYTEIETR